MRKNFLKKFSICGCYLDFSNVYEVRGKKRNRLSSEKGGGQYAWQK